MRKQKPAGEHPRTRNLRDRYAGPRHPSGGLAFERVDDFTAILRSVDPLTDPELFAAQAAIRIDRSSTDEPIPYVLTPEMPEGVWLQVGDAEVQGLQEKP